MVLESRTWTGRRAEDCAVKFLKSLGHRILARNWRWRRAEIDVISRFGDTVVFLEVKARSGCGTDLDSRHWMPSQAQQRRIVRAAHAYLRGCGSVTAACRFDVVLVRPDVTPVTV
ncbi:MAG: YraN family protein, partial [Flavobacteriales bacterium]